MPDNGTLLQKIDYAGGPAALASLTPFSQGYSYDNLNRLTGVNDGGYSRNFGYDQYGNMWVSGSTVITPAGNMPMSASQFNNRNQIAGINYDGAGNQLMINGNNAAYDGENRMTTVSETPAFGGNIETLAYDGLGQRVLKTLPSGTTTYVFDAFGQLVAEYSSAPNTPPCTTFF
jgi:YD repeat-containing protein